MIILEINGQIVTRRNFSTATLGEDLTNIYVFLPSIFLKNFLSLICWRRFNKWVSGSVFSLKNKYKTIL